MFKVVKKEALNPTVIRISVEAPYVAKKAQPGQFIILRAFKDSERLPFTVSSTDPEKGTVSIIYQIVGGGTVELNSVKEGEYLQDFVGPLGKPSELAGLKSVAVVGGGVGCAIALPIAVKLHELGADVTSVVGFRNKDLVILEKEFVDCSNKLVRMSDDGSWGQQGFVTTGLENEILAGKKFDEVIAIGPIVMMKNIVAVTKKYNIKTIVSMNPIMIDGTGMCGCCRVKVGGKLKFACVDGPDFDGFEVDFDSAANRNTVYREFEHHAYEKECNLLNKKEEK